MWRHGSPIVAHEHELPCPTFLRQYVRLARLAKRQAATDGQQEFPIPDVIGLGGLHPPAVAVFARIGQSVAGSILPPEMIAATCAPLHSGDNAAASATAPAPSATM
jgi:hypothetical protein